MESSVTSVKPLPLLFIISGPSGAGKGTAARAVCEKMDQLVRIPTYTTRAKRLGETHGVDYSFVAKNDFFELVKAKTIYEFTRTYADDYYGAPAKLLTVDESRPLICELDPKGAFRTKALTARKVVTIFITPPTLSVLKDRISARGEEKNHDRRIEIASDQISVAWCYDYVIVNDNVTTLAENMIKIIQVEVLRQAGLCFLANNWTSFDNTLKKNE